MPPIHTAFLDILAPPPSMNHPLLYIVLGARSHVALAGPDVNGQKNAPRMRMDPAT